MSEQDKKDVESATPEPVIAPASDVDARPPAEAAASEAPTSEAPRSEAPTSEPTSAAPTSEAPTSEAPTSEAPEPEGHEISTVAEAARSGSQPASSSLLSSSDSGTVSFEESMPGVVAEARAAAPAAPSAARPPRKPAEIARGVAITLLGAVPLFTIMSLDHQIARGPLWGIFATFVLALGVLDLLGLFTPSASELAGARPWRETWIAPDKGEPFFVAPIVAIPVAALIVVLGALFASWSALPWIIIAALACLVPAAIRRPGLLVFTFGSAIILPFLGAMGLWDPWETHYGEVAREILSRDDWISLWWAHEEWFFSKPIFIFWVEALSMGALGVGFQPHDAHAHPLATPSGRSAAAST
jgi:hypothetical protein